MYWAASKSQIKTVMSILLLLLSLGANNVVSGAQANDYDTTQANCSSLSVEPLNFRKFHLSNALHAEKVSSHQVDVIVNSELSDSGCRDSQSNYDKPALVNFSYLSTIF